MTTKVITALMIAMALTGCQTMTTSNQPVTNTDGTRQVNQVRWDKTGDTFSVPSTAELTNSEARLIFIRPLDQDPLQSSVNIGIDDRFQVSLQPGQYSEVVTCQGNHQISAEITGNKNNKLIDKSPSNHLSAQTNHYYLVVVDNAGQPSIGAITQAQAAAVINSNQKALERQTHQISRVVDTCTAPVVQAPVITPVKPALQEDPIEINTPIKLDVLFDFDSANIKPDYNQRLENMARFMQAHTDMSAVLEGHTDSKGPASYNLRLSEARAKAVKTTLVTQYGADANRLTTVGYGETRPIDTNDTAAGRQNNRRVVAIINQSNQ